MQAAAAALAEAQAEAAKQDHEAIWKLLNEAKDKGFLIGTACTGRGDGKQKEFGLQVTIPSDASHHTTCPSDV